MLDGYLLRRRWRRQRSRGQERERIDVALRLGGDANTEEDIRLGEVDHAASRPHLSEQGHGAKGHETANHFAALRKREEQGLESSGSYDAAVAELWQRDPSRAERLGLPRAAEEC